MSQYFALFVLAKLGVVSPHGGLATIYFRGDRSSGSHKADGSKFINTDKHIAHRWLPLGTVGYLCNTRNMKCVLTSVRDRGPFGALRDCKHGTPAPYRVKGITFRPTKIRWLRRCAWWQAQPWQLQRGFRYRGEFDVARLTAKEIELRAFDRVVFYGVRTWKKPSAVRLACVL